MTIALEYRARTIAGSIRPVSVDPIYLRWLSQETVTLDLDGILGDGIGIDLMSSIVKIGQGIAVSDLTISASCRAVQAKLDVNGTASRRHVVALLLTLNTAEIVEVNVPIDLVQ